MKEGARCSRIPPRFVSIRAMKERPSLRNSREQTVSSSNSSLKSRATGAGFGAFAAGAGALAGFAFGLAGFFLRAGFGGAFFAAFAFFPGFRATNAGIRGGD